MQELRLLAQGSKEPIWIDAFNNNEDLHSKMALLVFDNLDINDVKKPHNEIYVSGNKILLRGKEPRFVAKTMNFALA